MRVVLFGIVGCCDHDHDDNHYRDHDDHDDHDDFGDHGDHDDDDDDDDDAWIALCNLGMKWFNFGLTC